MWRGMAIPHPHAPYRRTPRSINRAAVSKFENDYRDLPWCGPARFDRLSETDIPDAPGLYVITSTDAPLKELFAQSDAPFLNQDRHESALLYAGRTASLVQRLRVHASGDGRLSRHMGGLAEQPFVYWAETNAEVSLERRLIEQQKPRWNTVIGSRVLSGQAAFVSYSHSGKPSAPGPIEVLQKLLDERVTDEARYQSFLTQHPWVLGLHFELIESHRRFDDRNIPDFTGVRSRDGTRDIVEIKQPFLELQVADGSISNEFHKAWAQAERYLDFAIREADYLRRQKNLSFENPSCFLILAYEPDQGLLDEFQRKQRMNPRIVIVTYDRVVRMAQQTLRQAATLQRFCSPVQS
jgi:hypothetical protein